MGPHRDMTRREQRHDRRTSDEDSSRRRVNEDDLAHVDSALQPMAEAPRDRSSRGRALLDTASRSLQWLRRLHSSTRSREHQASRAGLRAGHDDRQAITTLYREHARFIWRVLGRFGIREQDREDLMHEVFITAHRRIDRFDGTSASSWLFGIARRVAANHTRKQRRRHSIPEGLDQYRPRSPEQLVSEEECQELLQRFLDRLSPRHREVFELSEIDGLSGPEIARALDCKLNTVYTRLRTARLRFRTFARRAAATRKQKP